MCKEKVWRKRVLIRLGLRMSGLRQFPNCTAQELGLVRRWVEGPGKLPNCTTESRSSLVPPISLPFPTCTAKCANSRGIIFSSGPPQAWPDLVRFANQTNWNIFWVGCKHDHCIDSVTSLKKFWLSLYHFHLKHSSNNPENLTSSDLDLDIFSLFSDTLKSTSFKLLCDRKRHIKKMHASKKFFICDVCNNSFDIKANLKSHEITHTREKPFSCEHCEHRSTRKDDLKKHMRTHTMEKMYQCSQCQYSCNTLGSMRRHTKIHSGEKPHKCIQCAYSCIEAGRMQKHIETHSGKKTFKCSFCNKMFQRVDALRVHIKTHTGEKLHQCNQCEYKCIAAGTLKNHLKTHSLEKPLKCSQCPYSCFRSYHLRMHAEKIHNWPKHEDSSDQTSASQNQAHSGDKFKCNNCGFPCASKRNLLKHVFRHHWKEPRTRSIDSVCNPTPPPLITLTS